MERATAVQLRKSLETASAFVKAGIRFIPMPVLDDSDEAALVEQVAARLEKAINESAEPAQLSEEER